MYLSLCHYPCVSPVSLCFLYKPEDGLFKLFKAAGLWTLYYHFLSFDWYMTGNRMRERGSDTQQRAPGRNSNLWPLHRGQSICTWDTLPTELNGTWTAEVSLKDLGQSFCNSPKDVTGFGASPHSADRERQQLALVSKWTLLTWTNPFQHNIESL